MEVIQDGSETAVFINRPCLTRKRGHLKVNHSYLLFTCASDISSSRLHLFHMRVRGDMLTAADYVFSWIYSGHDVCSRWKQSLPLKRGANRIPAVGINIHWSQACLSDDQSYFTSAFGHVNSAITPISMRPPPDPLGWAVLRFKNSLPHFFKLWTCAPLCIISLIYANDCWSFRAITHFPTNMLSSTYRV